MVLARPRLLVLALTALTIAAAALVLGLGPSQAGAAAKVKAVTIKDMAFGPATITVRVGQKVRWTNTEDMDHTVTPDKTGGPKGPTLGQDDTYTWTAKKVGTFPYHCVEHSFMTGKIVVKK